VSSIKAPRLSRHQGVVIHGDIPELLPIQNGSGILYVHSFIVVEAGGFENWKLALAMAGGKP